MRRARGPLRTAAAGLTSGALVGFSLPPWGWWPLAFVGLAVLHLAARTPEIAPTPAEASSARGTGLLALGSWFGISWLGLGMVWMWFLSAPGYIAATLLFGLVHGLATVVAGRGPWSSVIRPAAHTVAEAIRFAFPFGGVPLASLAISQSAGPLIWLGRLGGPLLITWATLQLAVSLADLRFVRFENPVGYRMSRSGWGGPAVRSAVRIAARVARPAIGAGLVLVALALAVTVAPAGRTGAQGSLRIGVVQGGGPQGTRAINSDPRVVLDRHLAGTKSIVPGSVDLVLWPENIIDVATFEGSPELGEVTAEARRLGVPMVVSITEDTTDNRFTNAQVVVTPDGTILSRYDKVRRVPFGEYMPMRGLLAALGAPTDLVPRDAKPGTGPAVLDLPGNIRLGVSISWEVFFGPRVRDAVTHGGEVVVNPTNGSSYTWTVLQTQQVASSKLRAVEEGRWVVQAAPTGFSGFIDPTGGVHQRTAVGEAKVLIGTVERYTGRTWYSYTGDRPVEILALGVAIGAIVISRRRTHPTATSSTD